MRQYKYIFLLFVIVLLSFRPVVAQNATPSAQSVEEIDVYIQKIVEKEQFSGAVLVAQGEKVLLSKGYGLANREWDVPNTPQTKFRIGSITKQFTAMSILLLAEQDKLAVEDPICQYIKDCPDSWQPITIHQLLTHISGIPNFTDFPDYFTNMKLPMTPDKLISSFIDKPLNFEAGSSWSYSNSGYIVLGKIIEVASGSSYRKFLTTNLFEPLGMADTGYDSATNVIKNRAQGYATTDRSAAYIDMTVPYAAGALYSTVEDLHRWNEALQKGKVIQAETYEAMLKAAVLLPQFGENARYSYGLFLGAIGGHPTIEHGGAINGFVSDLVYLPDDDLTFVILSNLERSDPSLLVDTSLKILFKTG